MNKIITGLRWFFGGIGFLFAFIFYYLFERAKEKNVKTAINFATKEAELKARERHEKVKDDPIATANDIADILHK